MAYLPVTSDDPQTRFDVQDGISGSFYSMTDHHSKDIIGTRVVKHSVSQVDDKMWF